MIDLTASVDGVAVDAFNAALKELSDSLGGSAAEAPRMAALQMTRNFQAATRMAKPKRPVVVEGLDRGAGGQPPWITFDKSRGGRLPYPLRLVKISLPDRKWSIERYRGVRGAETSGQIEAATVAEYERLYTFKESPTGTRGLAKRSWGWVRHNIYERKPMDAVWKMRRGDRRNPMDATAESTSSVNRGTLVSSGYARVCNRLDYIGDALKRSEDEVLRKAASAIVKVVAVKKMRRMGGMGKAEVKAEAEAVKNEFMRQFPPSST